MALLALARAAVLATVSATSLAGKPPPRLAARGGVAAPASPSPHDFGAAGLNAKDFGAVGDGVADDAAALTAAIDAATAQGRTLLLPAGTYRVNSTVSVPPTGGCECTDCACWVDTNHTVRRRPLRLVGEGNAITSILCACPPHPKSITRPHPTPPPACWRAGPGSRCTQSSTSHPSPAPPKAPPPRSPTRGSTSAMSGSRATSSPTSRCSRPGLRGRGLSGWTSAAHPSLGCPSDTVPCLASRLPLLPLLILLLLILLVLLLLLLLRLGCLPLLLLLILPPADPVGAPAPAPAAPRLLPRDDAACLRRLVQLYRGLPLRRQHHRPPHLQLRQQQ